jgi:hypothetical protein
MKAVLRGIGVSLGLCLGLLARPCSAQTTFPGGTLGNSVGNGLGNNTLNSVPDTAQGRPIAKRKKDTAADSARRTERLLFFRLTKPAKAGLLSLILPGGGQIYNHSYWKLPLVYGGIGAVTAAEFFYQSRYKEYVNSKKIWLTTGTNVTDPGPRSRLEISRANVETGLAFYRGWRDRFIAYTLVVYGITALDAVVDAHLSDFDVSDDLSLQWHPTLIPMPSSLPMPGVALTLNLNSKRSTK